MDDGNEAYGESTFAFLTGAGVSSPYREWLDMVRILLETKLVVCGCLNWFKMAEVLVAALNIWGVSRGSGGESERKERFKYWLPWQLHRSYKGGRERERGTTQHRAGNHDRECCQSSWIHPTVGGKDADVEFQLPHRPLVCTSIAIEWQKWDFLLTNSAKRMDWSRWDCRHEFQSVELITGFLENILMQAPRNDDCTVPCLGSLGREHAPTY